MSEGNLPQTVETDQTAVTSTPTDPWAREMYFVDDVEQHPAVRVIRASFPDAILDIVRFRDETTIHIRPELLRDICQTLRAHENVRLDFLTDVTAVDMLRLRESATV